LERAAKLGVPGVILEFEALLEMTRDPDLGVACVEVLSEECENGYEKYGLPCDITAMVPAEKGYIPTIFAASDRRSRGR
jgi:hypothetical protein